MLPLLLHRTSGPGYVLVPLQTPSEVIPLLGGSTDTMPWDTSYLTYLGVAPHIWHIRVSAGGMSGYPSQDTL
jgi:hypothetical protein